MAEKSYNLLTDIVHSPKIENTADLTVDDDINRIVITVDRTAWNISSPDVLVTWRMWRSEDGGLSWLDAGSSATHGGIIIDDKGVEYTVSKWSMSWPPGTKRWVKLQIDIKRETRTKIDLDTLI